MGMKSATDSVYRELIKGCAHPNDNIRNDYIIMADIFIKGGLDCYLEECKTTNTEETRWGIKKGTNKPRYHFNPMIEITINDKPLRGSGNLLWVISNYTNPRTCTTTLTFMARGTGIAAIAEEKIQNSTYRVSYYNMLSALWRGARVNKDRRTIMMHKEESALRALQNLLNRDQRIIQLREAISQGRITIKTISKDNMTQLVEKLRKLKPPTSEAISENWPNVELQKEANHRTQLLKKYNTVEAQAYLTRTMRQLCMIPTAWQEIPLDELTNQTLIMLTGLVTDEYRKLVRGELTPIGTISQNTDCTKFPGCKCTRRAGSPSNTLVHRITECPKYRKAREEIFGEDTQTKKVNKIILGIDHSHSPVHMLKKLAKIAL